MDARGLAMISQGRETGGLSKNSALRRRRARLKVDRMAGFTEFTGRILHILVNPVILSKNYSSDVLLAAVDSAFQTNGSVAHACPRCWGRKPKSTIRPFPILTSA